MFFRFAAALVLVVIVSIVSVTLEKGTLELRRAVSRQYYQTDLLIEQHVRLRLETQKLTAPSQLKQLEQSWREASGSRISASKAIDVHSRRPPLPENAEPSGQRLPLLRFQHPFRPEGID